jgi:hypothetical protein
MRSKEKIVLLIFLLLSTGVLAQHKIKKYNFIVENPLRNKLDSLLFDGIMYEFQTEREFLNDSVFIEKNMLGHDSDTFRVSPFKWEIRHYNKWEIFHGSIDFPKKIRKWGNHYLIPRSKYYYEGELFYTYFISNDKGKYDVENSVIIYFNMNLGIVKIKYSNFMLLRSPMAPLAQE